MRPIGSTGFGQLADLGPLLLRAGVGAVFAAHGWQKYDAGVDRFAGTLSGLDVPAPDVAAWLAVAAEGIGGVLLILGLLTRLVTVPLIAVMIGAMLLVKIDVGFVVMNATGAELDTALLAGLLALVFIGPGRWSLDQAAGLETTAAPSRSSRASRDTAS